MPQAESSVYALCCLFLFLNWDTRCSVLKTEVSVGTVHVASFAFQALVVTNEQVAFPMADLVHVSSTASRGSSSEMSSATPRLAQMSACTSAKRLATPIPMRSAFFLYVPGSGQVAIVLPPLLPPRLPKSLQAVEADLALRDHVLQV